MHHTDWGLTPAKYARIDSTNLCFGRYVVFSKRNLASHFLPFRCRSSLHRFVINGASRISSAGSKIAMHIEVDMPNNIMRRAVCVTEESLIGTRCVVCSSALMTMPKHAKGEPAFEHVRAARKSVP